MIPNSKIKIITIYPSEDIHCVGDFLQKYLFVGETCVLSGKYNSGIKDKIIGAVAVLLLNENIPDYINVADSNLYYFNVENNSAIYEKLVTSKIVPNMYGFFQ